MEKGSAFGCFTWFMGHFVSAEENIFTKAYPATSCAVDEEPVPVKRWAAQKNNCENQGSDVTIANGNQSIPVNIMWYSLIFHIIPCYSQHMSRGLSSIFQQGAGFSNSSYWTQSASHGATSSVSSMHGRSPRGVLCRRWSFKGLISARKHHWAKKVEN